MSSLIAAPRAGCRWQAGFAPVWHPVFGRRAAGRRTGRRRPASGDVAALFLTVGTGWAGTWRPSAAGWASARAGLARVSRAAAP